jgi:hypothetical protein
MGDAQSIPVVPMVLQAASGQFTRKLSYAIITEVGLTGPMVVLMIHVQGLL